MEKENKKKTLVLLIVGVVALLVLVAGATYAYFQAQINKSKETPLNVHASTTDLLTFSMQDINLSNEKR